MGLSCGWRQRGSTRGYAFREHHGGTHAKVRKPGLQRHTPRSLQTFLIPRFIFSEACVCPPSPADMPRRYALGDLPSRGEDGYLCWLRGRGCVRLATSRGYAVLPPPGRLLFPARWHYTVPSSAFRLLMGGTQRAARASRALICTCRRRDSAAGHEKKGREGRQDEVVGSDV